MDGLVEAGAAVRALVRDPATARLPEVVDVVTGDLGDPSSVRAALAEVDSVFLLWPFFSADAAPAITGLLTDPPCHVVYLSAEAAAHDPDSFWAQVEQTPLEANLPLTVLRPTGFAKNTYTWIDQIRAGVVHAPFGAAARSLIDERDIAAVAVLALTEPGHAGQTYVLTGPATVTQAQQVNFIGDALDHAVEWSEQSPDDARPGLIRAFGHAGFADRALTTWAGYVEHPEIVTTTVADLTGTPARTFDQWAIDHANQFRPQQPHIEGGTAGSSMVSA